MVIKTFEHATLRLGEEGFMQEHWEKLQEWEARLPEHKQNKFLVWGKNSVRFKQYVGIIYLGGLTIEILPKIDASKGAEEAGKAQKVLLQMLQVCGKILLDSAQDSPVELQSLSILEVFIEMYLRELEGILRRGLVKQYKRQEGNLTYLKGALKFDKHIAKNATNQARFYTVHHTYSPLHFLHQILYTALQTVSNMTQNVFILDKIRRLQIAFPAMQTEKITKDSFKRIQFSRKTRYYIKAIRLARLILLHYTPDVIGGRQDAWAILVDMNRLFEQYIARILDYSIGDAFEIQTQRKYRFWNALPTAALSIKPDIVLIDRKNPAHRFVIDTKWKIPTDKLGNIAPSATDIYQMFAYSKAFKAKKVFLWYPSVTNDRVVNGKYIEENAESYCDLLFMSLLDGDSLCIDAKKILDYLK
jgi:5-methylcytosine-specific restriction enzyme subunit McrC